MGKAAFEIYNASAGSGKTRTLVKEYLKILLASKKDDAYKNILAITFTNKAVEEMKTRIVETLEAFTHNQPGQDELKMMQEIAIEINISVQGIREKSKRIIKNIIHNYASFSISTIDKFAHQIIRSFALDLDLPMSFEVSLDTDKLIAEAVDNMLAEAGENEMLTNLLIDFATQKTDDDKSWDITNDFLKIGKELQKETNRKELLSYQNKELIEFLEIKRKIKQNLQKTEEQIVRIAENALELIDNNGNSLEAYFNYIPNHFQKIASKKNKEVKKTLYKYLDPNDESPKDPYKKNTPQDIKEYIDSLCPRLLEAYDTINKLSGKYLFYEAFLNNFTPLSVMNLINQEIIEIQLEKNILSISEFNNIIHKQIREQPAPFIYEKLGDRYNHFFIDEFQDTSILQWENLFPLIENALSGENEYGEKGTLMIVGDPKQSIYRWRGGKAELFIKLSEEKSPFPNPDKKTISLDDNYRSYTEIINFNNHFFGFLANEFSDPRYFKIYQESKQNPKNKIGGYVNISFADIKYQQENKSQEEAEEPQESPNKNDKHLNLILQTVKDLIQKGFSYGEIAILVRNKRNGTLIANLFVEKEIPFVSSETLLISKSDEILFIINLLELIKNTKNLRYKAEILYFLAHKKQIKPIHDFIKEGMDCLSETSFETWLASMGFVFSFEKTRQKPLYEIVEMILSIFLKDINNIYTQNFLDMVLEQNMKKQAGIDDFLEFWKEEGYLKNIPSPQRDAIQIMTIHQSKGLQFPVVIFPFVSENYSKSHDEKIWLKGNDESLGLSKFLVNKKSEVSDYSEEASEIYQIIKQEDLLDQINLLYVALTRAVEQLYVITEISFDKNLKPGNTAGKHFVNYLKEEKIFDLNQLVYSFGNSDRVSLKKESKQRTCILHGAQSQFDSENIQIATLESLMWDTPTQDAITYGNLIHKILSWINTPYDIETAIIRALDEGLLRFDQKDTVSEAVRNIVSQPELQIFYSSENRVFNERTIIRKDENIIKPDKVILLQGQKALLLDYKTGAKSEKHLSQINNYAQALIEMGYEVLSKKLVYINKNTEIVSC